MTSRHVPGYESGYGLALYTGHWQGHRAVGHGGMLASYNCLVTAFPEHGTAVVLQSCWDDGRDVMALIDLLHRTAIGTPIDVRTACACPPVPRPALVSLSGLVGDWLDVHTGILNVAEQGDAVVITKDEHSAPVQHTPDGPIWEGRPLGVVRRPDGSPAHLVLDGEPAQPFTHRSFDADDDITWLAGEYRAWEVDLDPARLEVVEGQLIVDWWQGRVPATRVGPAAFVSGYGLLEVERQDDHVVLVAGGGARLLRTTPA